MIEPLIIVGAGGHGRETALAYLLGERPESFLGFLDDQLAGNTPEGWPILGRVEDAGSHVLASFVVAVNDPRTRRDVAMRLARAGATRWGTVRHPDVRLHASVRYGIGCSFLGACQVTASVSIGDHCILNRMSQLSHDCSIGSFCSLNPGSCVAGGCRIDDGCELGSMCSIRQNLKIGQGATVGMGAVVVRPADANVVLAGNPARPLTSRRPW